MSLLHQRAVWSGMAAMMACGLLTAGAAPGASATAMTGMARLAASAAAGQLSTARQVPGLNALNAGGNARVNSVSCGSPGNCAAVGAYTDASGNLLPFVADEKNGTWGNAQTLDFATISTKSKAEALSVSCASAGNCSAVGYINPAGVLVAFTADEKGGTWGRATLIPGVGGLESEAGSVSCPTAGNCAADGFVVTSGGVEPFTVSATNGTWGNAQQLTGTGTSPQLRSVSCATPGNCAIGGFGTDASGHVQAFVADLTAATAAPGQTATATDLALSAATVTFGQEQAVKISVTVTAPVGGTPAGLVTVTADRTAICVIALRSGTGSCPLSARELRPGSHRLTASYFGGKGFATSASAPATLTVTR